MAMSYHRILGDQLANHLIYLSSSSSFWFSLNSSYDNKFHLSKQLGMSAQDYEYLLMALDLASIHKRVTFASTVTVVVIFIISIIVILPLPSPMPPPLLSQSSSSSSLSMPPPLLSPPP